MAAVDPMETRMLASTALSPLPRPAPMQTTPQTQPTPALADIVPPSWPDEATTVPPSLFLRHCLSLHEGSVRQVEARGDAESLLWEAPRERVVQRHYRHPLPGSGPESSGATDLHALVDADGWPVAWWQRFVLGADPWPAWALPYAIEHQSIHAIEATSGPSAPKTAFAHPRAQHVKQHVFYIESFMDELAHAMGRDPLAYRLGLLKAQPVHSRLLQRAAQRIGWDQAHETGRCLGLALAGAGGVAVQMMDVSADGTHGLRVHRVVVGVSCAPGNDRLATQAMVAASVQASLKLALEGLQPGPCAWHPDLDPPEIVVDCVEQEGVATPAAEQAAAATLPALCNALFLCTGQRVREWPVSAGR
jgi:hypothetical protein